MSALKHFAAASRAYHAGARARRDARRPAIARVVCTYCGTRDETRTHTRGSFGVELLLWCCFILPGLIYSAWRLAGRGEVCGECGHAALIPAGSPRGRDMLKSQYDARTVGGAQ